MTTPFNVASYRPANWLICRHNRRIHIQRTNFWIFRFIWILFHFLLRWWWRWWWLRWCFGFLLLLFGRRCFFRNTCPARVVCVACIHGCRWFNCFWFCRWSGRTHFNISAYWIFLILAGAHVFFCSLGESALFVVWGFGYCNFVKSNEFLGSLHP